MFFCVCTCSLYACSCHRGQERVSAALELEMQMVVNHRVGEPRSSVRPASALTKPSLQPSQKLCQITVLIDTLFPSWGEGSACK